MISFKEFKNERLGEKCLYGVHSSGLEVFLVPKDHKKSYAIFGTRYGAMHRTFKTDSDPDFVTVPDGIAHFLEHKLFENEDGSDTFSLYAQHGANANAFTSNELTAYLFSATGDYYENLEILLKFVTSPYFTKETVDKEMGIIGQELRMYLDNPYRRLYKNLLDALYVNNHAKIDVGGTEESIAKITPEILYRCYGTFYNLHNMTLCLCGSFDPEKVSDVMDKTLKPSEPINITHKFPEEPDRVNKSVVTEKFNIALPMFYLGIKDTPFSDFTDPKAILKKICAHEVLLEILFGRSSDFYNDLYESGMVNDKFSSGYIYGKNFSFVYFAAETREPEKVAAMIREEIEKAKSGKYGEVINEAFERSRRTVYADCVQEWNSTSDIADNILDLRFIGADVMGMADAAAELTVSDVLERLRESYDLSLSALSIIVPDECAESEK